MNKKFMTNENNPSTMGILNRKESVKTVSEEVIKDSEKWKKSYISFYFNRSNYRKKNSSKHAVCRNGKCKVHIDNYSAHDSPIKHLREDVPLSKTIASFLFLGSVSYIVKKFR